MPDYIPGNDLEFDEWAERFNTYINTNFLRLGLTNDDVNTVDTTRLTWHGSLVSYNAAQVAAKTATQVKYDDRASLEALLRTLVGRIQVAPGTTNADREALGLTVRGASTSGLSLETIADTPIATVENGTRYRHVMRISNQTGMGISKGKPAGALGCEIYMKIGDQPTDPSECTLHGIATRSPYVIDFNGADGGKQVHYYMRWVNNKGEKGPWSELESVTIAA